MRTVEVSLAGVVYSMPVNFAASMQISEQVADPFKLAIGLANGVMLTAPQVVQVITVGVRCAGCQLERDQIGDQIVDAGMQDFLTIAAKYIVSLVSGSPAVPATGTKKKRK